MLVRGVFRVVQPSMVGKTRCSDIVDDTKFRWVYHLRIEIISSGI